MINRQGYRASAKEDKVMHMGNLNRYSAYRTAVEKSFPEGAEDCCSLSFYLSLLVVVTKNFRYCIDPADTTGESLS